MRAATSSPSSTSGGGSNRSYTPYQRSYNSYQLHQQRQQFLYGYGYGLNPYGTRWTRSYVPRLSGDTKPSFVSLTTLAAPKAARKAYKKAEKQINTAEPNLDLAAQHLQKAISIYPEYAAAWTLLGRVQHRAGDPGSAAQSLERAIEIDPKYLAAYEPLASLAVEQKRWDDLLRLSDQMLRINPVFALGHYYKGGALIQKGDRTGAEKALQAALTTPDAALFPESHYVLAELYRTQNEVELAAREYRLYTASPPRSASWEQAQRRLQQWEDSGIIEPQSAKKKRKKPTESR
ncbi:MAG: tetratricopeptide repeat protein [Acidobacteria bacterium]|nr:tetratricopeptide repeat protein [Acidobacteriota bacterium]